MFRGGQEELIHPLARGEGGVVGERKTSLAVGYRLVSVEIYEHLGLPVSVFELLCGHVRADVGVFRRNADTFRSPGAAGAYKLLAGMECFFGRNMVVVSLFFLLSAL